jgi:hypothetical protein
MKKQRKRINKRNLRQVEEMRSWKIKFKLKNKRQKKRIIKQKN